MWRNRVVWSEGLFLRPHHFQQQERALDHAADRRARALAEYSWGFERLELDSAALSMGRLQVNAAAGLLPDGTPFSFPDQDPPPAPVEVRADAKNQLVYLALPLDRQGVASVGLDAPAPHSLVRYMAADADLPDVNEGFSEAATVQLARLSLRLVAGPERSGAFALMPVACVAERRPDGQLLLDAGFVPPSLASNDSPVLRGFLHELIGKLRQRIDELAAGMGQPGRGGVAEIAEFLLLQTYNRHGALLDHLAGLPRLHPERLYTTCVQLAGELATFVPDRRLTEPFPAYDHDDLQATFRPVMTRLRQFLSFGPERNALRIPLHDRKYGVRVAVVADRELLRSAGFVLAVNAQLPAEALRQRFPTQVKIGPVEKLRDLVNLQLPGIGLQALPVAPRQIPYHAGYSYFELDRGNELWPALERSSGLAMHIAGDFPALELEFWAIRG